MKRTLLFFTVTILVSFKARSQQISLDTAGRLYGIEMKNPSDSFSLKVSGELSADPLRKKLDEFFLRKIDSTLPKLSDAGSVHYRYLNGLWGGTTIGTISNELKQLGDWIRTGATPGSFTYLNPLYNKLKELRSAGNSEWFALNGQTMQGFVKLGESDLGYKNSYTVELRQNLLFNKFLTGLFNDTYSAADNPLAKMTTASFASEDDILDGFLKRLSQLTWDVNRMTDDDYHNMIGLHNDIRNDAVVKSLESSAFVKNWIWLREGEPTLNPFEKQARDTAKAGSDAALKRSANVSFIDSVSVQEEFLNRIRLPKAGDKDTRNIHFFITPGRRAGERKVEEQLDEIKQPVRGDQNVKVSVHNLFQDEWVELQTGKKTGHSGRNSTMEDLSSALDILTSAYAQFTALKPFLKTFGNKIEKTRSIQPALSNKAWSSVKKKDILDAFSDTLEKAGKFNPYLFKKTADSVKLPAIIQKARVQSYIDRFASRYQQLYNQFVNSRNGLVDDSIIVVFSKDIVAQTNLPPAKIITKPAPGIPKMRTEILATGAADEDSTTTYIVRNFLKKGSVTDSSTFATFKVKSGKLKRMMASAGLMFTSPRSSYAENTFTPGTASAGAVIETSRKTASFVVGLNIYFSPINMLDNHWFGSKECKVWSRFSLFLGLDVPDVTDHFYPGISYDVIPGFKITAGPHLYRHKMYSIVNNTIEDQGRVLRVAGTFVGVGIDPETLVKAINIFK